MENKLSPSTDTWSSKISGGEYSRLPELDFTLFADRLRFLHSLLVAPYKLLIEQCSAYLQSGCKMLSLDYGALVQVREGRLVYFIYQAETDTFTQKEEPCGETRFFHDPDFEGRTAIYPNAGQTAVNLNNMAYNGDAISRYLGTHVAVTGDSFGVLCFFSVSQAEASAFVPHDVETIELMAEGVARMIELQTAQPKDASTALGGFATPGVKSLEEYITQARLPDVYGIPGRVVEVLQRRIGHSSLAIDHIAEELNLSKRTLQRRLQQQHINFAQLRDQVRFHFSIDYLIDQNISIDSISGSLDFSDRTSFTNAFKRWTGLSPSTFRKLFRDYT